MQTIARKITFCYGHRIKDHEGACANLHGHNATIWIHARPKPQLDKLGRVIDFAVIKNKVKEWVDNNWDHNMILWDLDRDFIDKLSTLPIRRPYLLDGNPTAENFAQHLLTKVCPQLFKDEDIEIYKIVFFETENCAATATL